MIIGLVLNLLGVRLGGDNVIEGMMLKFMESLAAVAIPLILFSIVLNLEVDIKAVKRTLPFSFGSIAVAVMLAIIWSFAWKIIPLSPIAKGALLVMSLLLPSLYPSVLAEGLNLSGNHKEYASQLFSVTVFISIILLLIISPFIPKLITLW